MSRDHAQAPRDAAAYALREDRPNDPNLDNLIDNWREYQGRLIVFLGAGASVGARGGATHNDSLPTALWLRNELWSRFMLTDQERATFNFSQLGMMTLEHATAIIQSRKGRTPLVELVSRMYDTNRPLWSHIVLPLLRPRAVFTTNYDQLVEHGWNACRGQRHVESRLTPIFAGGQHADPADVPLFKPHGSVERALSTVGEGGLVITMFDYFAMLGRKRDLLHQWLKHVHASCAVFIGYSFMDMDIASYLFELRRRDSGLPWYAVLPRRDDDVKRMYETEFGIRQISRTTHEFFVDLDAAIDFVPAALKATEIPELQRLGHIQ